MQKPIVQVLQGKQPDRLPIWLMRQAGRYLPEYRNLRAKSKDFLNLCLTPKLASEVTLQPLRRFDLDAAIIFADILLVPMALGVALEFREGEGPVLAPLEDELAIERLFFDNRKVEPVYESLRRVKAALTKNTALIGFCGAPWTVACYMIDGNSKKGFSRAQQWSTHHPLWLDKLVEKLVDASVTYLGHQIDAGADVVQIFDSWSGLLSAAAFDRWVIRPTRDIVSRLKIRYPHIGVIGFPRQARDNYESYARQTGVDGVGLDQDVDIKRAKKDLQPLKPLQGNLDPALLVEGGETMKHAAQTILKDLGLKHIFNLGHGVVPQTPPEHVSELVKIVRDWEF